METYIVKKGAKRGSRTSTRLFIEIDLEDEEQTKELYFLHFFDVNRLGLKPGDKIIGDLFRYRDSMVEDLFVGRVETGTVVKNDQTYSS
jgi:hypothetical protein